MTHAEIRARYPNPALEPTDCPGEPVPGRQSFDHCDGHRVVTLHCPACGRTIALDEHDRRTRNDYPDPRGGPGG